MSRSPQLNVSISEISLPGKGKSLPLMTIIIVTHMDFFLFFWIILFNFKNNYFDIYKEIQIIDTEFCEF